MRANALQSWLLKTQGAQVTVRRWQALEESSAIDHFGVGLYNFIQRRWPRAHHIYFNFLEVLGLHRHARGIRGKERLIEMVQQFSPDAVVSTHAHLNHGYFDVIRKTLPSSPPRCIIYCGELHGGYGFSKHWVNPIADKFIAATPACAEVARGFGMPSDRTMVGGFLLKPSFYEKPIDPPVFDSISARSAKKPIILLGTGANGANNHLRILKGIHAVERPLTFIALCGNNESAYRELSQIDISPHTVIPVSQQEDTVALLHFVDVAFIRPGSGMTSECIHCKCPILFNGIGGIMPQELITIKGTQKLGLNTTIVHRTGQFPETLSSILDHDSERAIKRQKAHLEQIELEASPHDIVEEVLR